MLRSGITNGFVAFAVVLAGCGRSCGDSQVTAVDARPADVAPSVVASASASASAVPPPVIPAGAIVFRTISELHLDADEDAGRRLPLSTTTVRVEAAGWASTDLEIACLHPTPTASMSGVTPRLLGAVSCYDSGETDVLAVVEKGPGAYAVVTWSREEGGPDDRPRPLALRDMKVLGAFRASAHLGGPVVLVEPDGRVVVPVP